MSEPVATVRRFHRTVTERIGGLQERYLGRNRPLGEARLLWEIGAEGATLRDLRDRLGLDSGYLSRMLRTLEEQKLVSVRTDPADRRVRRATLTARGRRERTLLDERSDALAARILEPLGEGARTRLVEAMALVERLVAASMVELAVEDPRSPDAVACLERYFAELARRFERGFDRAATPRFDADDMAPPRGLLVVARLRGRPVGCCALRLPAAGRTADPAEAKRMWVSDELRGAGLGARLLADVERRAAEAGATAIRLDTNRALVEAIALYRSRGYREIPRFNDEPHAHLWFEKTLGGRPSRSSRSSQAS